MLGKLLKYELRSTARILLPLYPALLIISFLNKILFSVLENSKFFDIPRGITMMLYVFMMIAMFVVTILIVLQRFHKNLLGEEGYLMFALPVKAEHHILAKLITSFIWFVSSCAVSLLSVFIMIDDYSFLKNFRSEYALAQQYVYEDTGMNLTVLIVCGIIVMIVYLIHFILQVYTAMSLGQLINKGRVALSFGAYIGINIVIEVIGMILIMIFSSSLDGVTFSEELIQRNTSLVLITTIGLGVALSVAEFFVTRFLLTRKLNVE